MITTIQEAEKLIVEKTAYILSLQGEVKEWRMKEHRALLRFAVLAAIQDAKTDKERNDAVSFVMLAGNAGNASQYRQGLKNESGARLFPAGKNEKVMEEYQ